MPAAVKTRDVLSVAGGLALVTFVSGYMILGPVHISGGYEEYAKMSMSTPRVGLTGTCLNCEQCADPCQCSARPNGEALPNGTEHLKQCDVPWRDNAKLPRAMTQSERQTAVELLREVDKIFMNHGIDYIMVYGTLLGSYMTHDFLPWDDDIDLFVKKSDYSKLVDGFAKQKWSSEIGIEKQYNAEAKELIKIFFRKSPRAGLRPWRWPFLDVAFYLQNATHVMSPDRKPLVIKKEDFYPFQRRPLASLWLPAPRDTRLFLQTRYKHFVCKNHWWNHKHEQLEKNLMKAECPDLLDDYPFVHRSLGVNGSSIETLKIGDKLIYRVHTPEPFFATGVFDFGPQTAEPLSNNITSAAVEKS